MLYIRYDTPKSQMQTRYSAFISFNYDAFYVEKIKELPTRYYNPTTKEWEIPTTLVDRLLEFESNIKELNVLEEKEVSFDNLEFKTEPMKHQIEGVKHGLMVNSWLLGDQQGLGKTKQIIDLAINRKLRGDLKHCLIICGINNLKYNWVNEIIKHSEESCCVLGKRGLKNQNTEPSMKNRLDDLKSLPPETFWITNIETLRMKKEGRFYKSEVIDILNEYIARGELSLIVVDEVHKAKNPTSAQGRGMLKLKGCPKIGMSGTLLVNKPLDLFVPLSLIEAMNLNYFTFQNRYTIKDGWGGVIGYKNTAELQDLMNTHMLRRTKALLDLPPKLHTVEYIEMSKEELKLYNEIVTATKEECDKIANPTVILAKLVRMRQVCCHTGLVSTKVVKSSKFERLRDILEEAQANNEKVIVFTMFRELVELALKEFEELKPLKIWGGMNSLELNEQINTFQNSKDFQVLFGVIQAAGTGITLNAASTVVFLDLPWNRATMEQAEDRAHRIGTKNTVNVISLLMKDSYDEHLHRMIIEKQAYGEIFVDGKSSKEFKKFLKVIFKEKGEFDDEDL